MPFTPTSYPGTLHHYTSRLTAFEHQPKSPSPGPRHTILFLGGLGDGLGHPQYPSVIAQHLPPSWTIVEVLLSSSYNGWTTSSLASDADELAKAVAYFRSLPDRAEGNDAKSIIMGHSTGSQVCMEYLVGPWKADAVPEATLQRPRVDGVILQAGISDREGLAGVLSKDELASSVELAARWIADGKGGEILPTSATRNAFGPSPSARRWASLAGVHGDDDYFSSDLANDLLDRTFGGVGKRGVPICIFLSDMDENMPDFVDKAALVQRWSNAVRRGGGKVGDETGLIPDATHNLNRSDPSVKERFAQSVSSFARSISAMDGKL